LQIILKAIKDKEGVGDGDLAHKLMSFGIGNFLPCMLQCHTDLLHCPYVVDGSEFACLCTVVMMVLILIPGCAEGASMFKGKRSGVMTVLQQKHAPFVEGVHCMVSSPLQYHLSSHCSFKLLFLEVLQLPIALCAVVLTWWSVFLQFH
jgi:hypothetical protein